MRDTFVKTLIDIAKANPNVELITGDLGFGVLKPFWEACPDQFINAGIAEQNMTSVAAGMALEGKVVFTYSIGNFPTLRCVEQIRNDCAYHNANVKIVCIGGGFVYGSLGMSHHATEDIAIMRALPDVSVFAPADAVEATEITKAIVNYPGTCYIRLGRGGEQIVRNEIADFKIGKAIKVRDGERIAIFSTGGIFDEISKCVEKLIAAGYNPTVYTFPTIKPLDVQIINEIAKTHELIVTCEEHNIVGGFGSAVAEVLSESVSKARLLRIGVPDTYCTYVGDQKFLRKTYGLDSETIYNRIRDLLK